MCLALFAGIIELIELASPGSGWRHYKVWIPLFAAAYWPLAFLAFDRRYGEERMAGWVTHQHSRLDVWMRRTLRYVLPVIALFFLVICLVDIGPSWRAAHGGGVVGTLTLTSSHCHNGGCTWSGDFGGAGGRATRQGVLMHDAMPTGAYVGEQLVARDTGDLTGVFAVNSSSDWQDVAALGAVSAAYLVGWMIWIVRDQLARRRPVTDPGSVGSVTPELDRPAVVQLSRRSARRFRPSR